MESEAAALVSERISGPILHQGMKLTFERGNDGDFRHDVGCSAATQTQSLKPQRTQSTQRNSGRLKLRGPLRPLRLKALPCSVIHNGFV